MTYSRIYFKRLTFLGHDQVDKLADDSRYTITRDGDSYLIARDGSVWEVPASNVASAMRAPVPQTTRARG